MKFEDLIKTETYDSILEKGLRVAARVGLPVTTWAIGDPTRSLYEYMAEILSSLETIRAGYAASGFLDTAVAFAEQDSKNYRWLWLLSQQVYGYTPRDATYATGKVELTHDGANHYDIDAGDLTFKNSVTGHTYHNTEHVMLPIGAAVTVAVAVEADIKGSQANASAGEISVMTTLLQGVSCANITPITGTDGDSPHEIMENCRAKVMGSSPGGTRYAYQYWARQASKEITKVKVTSDASHTVHVIVAGPAGKVSVAAIDAAKRMIDIHANPITNMFTVESAGEKHVSYAVTVYLSQLIGETTQDVVSNIRASVQDYILTVPIGGNEGKLYPSAIIAAASEPIRKYAYNIEVGTPVIDVGEKEACVLDNCQVNVIIR